MNPADKSSDLSVQVEKEHEHLRRELEELQASSSTQASGEQFAQWRLELIWQVRDFKNALLKHFDLEEEGGFMRDVRKMVPNSDPQVQELLAEHREMEQALDRILGTLKEMSVGDEDKLDRLKNQVGELVTTINSHETTEQHLIQRTYYRDYGGPE